MYQTLVEKARQRRRIALMQARMPQINIFWDGTPPPSPRFSVIAQMSDLRVRMGPPREALVAMTG